MELATELKRRRLPQFLRDMLANPPCRGEGLGLHNWIFRVARHLHAHFTEEEMISLLEQILAGSGATRREIVSAVRNSKAVAWGRSSERHRHRPPARAWPAFSPGLVATTIRERPPLSLLQELTPVEERPFMTNTEYIVDRLFPGNPLLCCGRSVREAATRQREEWRGMLSELQYIVPSPMARPWGLTHEGRQSARSLDNTGPRHFLVVESDHGTPEQQLAVILHLAHRAPLVLVVHSGGKSLHAWFRCAGQPEPELKKFFQYAARLGADRATFVPCQMVRMPGGRRENGNRQRVLFMKLGGAA